MVSDLLQETQKANARAAESAEQARIAVKNVKLLTWALGLPEEQIESASLAQSLTEEKIAEAAEETIPSVAGGSGSSSSRCRHSAGSGATKKIRSSKGSSKESITPKKEPVAEKTPSRKSPRAKSKPTKNEKEPNDTPKAKDNKKPPAKKVREKKLARQSCTKS